MMASDEGFGERIIDDRLTGNDKQAEAEGKNNCGQQNC